MASDPSLYRDLMANPLYGQAVINTVLYVGLGVNVKMFLALLAVRFLHASPLVDQGPAPCLHLPWALRRFPAFVSFHWMLIGEEGLVDSVLSALFGIDVRSGSMTAGSPSDRNIVATSGNGCLSGL